MLWTRAIDYETEIQTQYVLLRPAQAMLYSVEKLASLLMESMPWSGVSSVPKNVAMYLASSRSAHNGHHLL